MKKFKVYQLPTEHKAKFMRLSFVKKHDIMPKLEDYNLVYEGEVEEMEGESGVMLLDHIYVVFQGSKPADFKGHSLSMSDIVEVDGKYFYCDSYGWEEVTFQPKNTIRFDTEDVPELSELPKTDSSKSLQIFLDFKKKHPQAILLFRCGDFYEAYEDDAKQVAEICGTSLTDKITSFPYHALDTYLPKLIRSGNRVAICDPI